ncbi:MAG: division/cell wall cluster transcriptional repressor MraZ [Candidatus Glassbacteria bacterium RIFCSPLOWO2_12_FULL_58_11]|uniref:Transcriptional regulator MraZ n=2 Tax=Candidatus Glassiibacteriota TaxID=1817805 RepID=A0A1F5Z2H4_9BACT|nr:MAG: division/cell wall cluster transcriptional repressor MraZ [Candidatus Glassbacteria bacterium GWA2_58_10]OGG06616.1 MAG: division/cell wall cluster transcriptional repressor MraZ [Candidatus Glassbacteria bacterium RIFCSPLOWO2_12_FULL_58_11]
MKHWGRVTNSLDSKGRVSLPPRFRVAGVESYVLNRGLDGCLYLYTPEQYEKTLETLHNLPGNKKNLRFFMREWTKHTTDVVPDKQNRILISKELLELAGLKKEVIFQGANERVEIWDPERQEQYTRRFHEEQALTFEDIAEIFD